MRPQPSAQPQTAPDGDDGDDGDDDDDDDGDVDDVDDGIGNSGGEDD
jgi:hypothetical protein